MVASMVTFHKADIVGMQEVLLHQLQDLERSFKSKYRWIGAGREDGHMGGEFVPIFYKESKLELIESGNFWLSETPSIPGSLSWGAACPRMATWGVFHTKGHNKDQDPPSSKKYLMFVNTHLDHMSEVARIEGVKLIKQMIASQLSKIQQTGVGVVVVGDLNATENSTPIQTMVAPLVADGTSPNTPPPHTPPPPTTPPTTTQDGATKEGRGFLLQNAKYSSATPHHGPTGTFTGFKFEVKPPILIDYMFVGPGIQVARHGVLADTFGEGYAPSDHRPVVCDVSLL
jgi:endonuclease/exonuclease/phosphatase family metal-dependent hydrolase